MLIFITKTSVKVYFPQKKEKNIVGVIHYFCSNIKNAKPFLLCCWPDVDVYFISWKRPFGTNQ